MRGAMVVMVEGRLGMEFVVWQGREVVVWGMWVAEEGRWEQELEGGRRVGGRAEGQEVGC